MEAVLHIGTEKTGTTTIQASLHAGRDRLLGEGILYPRSVGSRHHRRLQLMAAGPDALGDPWLRMKGITDARALDRAVAGWHRDLERELADARRIGVRRVVLSSEHLQSRLGTDAQVERLRALLEGSGLGPLRIVVYLREQMATAVSLLSTRVLMGATLAEPPDPDAAGWGIVLDHRATLKRWGAVFGDDALVVRLFEPAALVGGDLLVDWSAAAGLPPPPDASSERRNDALSAPAIEVVRRLNRLRPAPTDESSDPVRAHAIAAAAAAFADGPGFVPRPELVRTYRERFAEGNAWVLRTRFPDRSTLFGDEFAGATAPGAAPLPEDVELERMAAEFLERAEQEVAAAARSARRRWPRSWYVARGR